MRLNRLNFALKKIKRNLYFIYLKAREKKERERNRDLPSSTLLPKRLQKPVLVQAIAQSQKLNPGLPTGY